MNNQFILINGIHYQKDINGKPVKYQAWLGDIFASFYDRIMEKSIFPKKFGGDIKKHFEILQHEFQQIENQKILDIAAGSGNVVSFISNNNHYSGTDISPGLLKIAAKKLKKANFTNFQFHICDVCNLPFEDDFYNVAICNLSINFFPDLKRFIVELKRVLKPDGKFFCTIPLPEKKLENVKIRGKLFTQVELADMFEEAGFKFLPLPYENGNLLYFWTIKLK